jgi:hypothetical protein
MQFRQLLEGTACVHDVIRDVPGVIGPGSGDRKKRAGTWLMVPVFTGSVTGTEEESFKGCRFVILGSGRRPCGSQIPFLGSPDFP